MKDREAHCAENAGRRYENEDEEVVGYVGETTGKRKGTDRGRR